MIVWKHINNYFETSNVFNWLVVLVLITLPLNYAYNSISVILLFLYSLVIFFKKRERFFSRKSILLISIFMLSAISILWSSNSKLSNIGIQKMLSYLVIPLSFSLVNAKKENKTSIKTLYIFAYSIGFYCFASIITSLVKYLKNGDKEVFFYHPLSEALLNMNAIYLSVFVAFSIGILFFKKQKTRVDYILTIFLCLFLFLLSSKSLIFSVIIFFVIYFLREKRKIPLKFYAIFFVSIVSLFFFTKNINKRILFELENTQLTEVLEKKDFSNNYIWSGFGLRVFQQKAFVESIDNVSTFLLGNGINASQEKLDNIYKKYKLYHGFYGYNYHNQYTQTFSEIGFLGFLLLIILLSISFKEALKQKNSLYLFFCYLIFMIFFTETFAWRARGMIFMITVFMIFDSTKQKQINV